VVAPAAAAQSSPPPPIVSGLKNPESVAVGPGGKIYVSVIGEFDKDGDGSIVVIENGMAKEFVGGLNDPKGIAIFAGRVMYVADKNRVLQVDLATGRATEIVKPEAFPNPPKFLNDVVVDPESGTVYVSDSGDFQGNGGAVYRISPPPMFKGKGPGPDPKKGPTVTVVVDKQKMPGLHTPNGLAMDGQSHLLMVDLGTGVLSRIKIATGAAEKVADGFGKADGVCWDHFGRLFVTDHPAGKLWAIPKPGAKPVLMAQGFQGAADICLGPDGKTVLVPDMKAGTVHAVPISIPGAEVDTSPLPLQAELAFPNLKWTDWKPQTDDGRPNQLRPILLTHFGDGSNRVVVPTQHGVIHVFPNDQAAKETTVFLDITDRVKYSDATNEEGFLGLAFHPKYKENGEFFVFYTPKYKGKGQNVVSRFRVSKTDPNKADPGSEEVLLRFDKPFWNHDGGTILFGPDGYLYVTHGDGGAANDPMENGQNLNSLLGKVLRIDVNAKEDGKTYAIPKDNPFAGRKDARGEIWAYGVRNLWRMAFDRKTGELWAGDVGQNLYEEIIIVTKGGNYGWNRRESYHPFGAKGVDVNKDMIEPIWEYHHDVGKSITGGNVYRGPRLPELDGYYLYGDYVSARIWALKYDAKAGRVVENRPVKDPNKPLYSFGEDEKGEVYFLTATLDGKGIYWFARTAKGGAGGR
jgi:glucose/arabinose dehydrogenase